MTTARTTTKPRPRRGPIAPDRPLIPVTAGDFWDEYGDAVKAYVDDHVRIVIDRVEFAGSAVNTGEEGTYEVLITNDGPIRMENVSIRFKGLNGTLVKGGGAIAQFTSEWVFDEMVDKVGPGRSHRIGKGDDHDTVQHLFFKAPSQASDEQELLEVEIANFDAVLDPLHNRDNGGGSGTWSAEVVPQ